MRKKLCILFVFIILAGTALHVNNLKIKNNYRQFVTQVNENKIYPKNSNKIDLSNYMYEYNPKELGIPKDKLKYITHVMDYSKDSSFTSPSTIAKSKAISDVDFIFDVIKYSYGGYSYFGGDSTFLKAKDNIINTIEEYDNDEISVYEFGKLLLKNFEFIKDKHFTINNNSLMSSIVYYSNENIEFKKSEDGYYTLKDKEKYYIKSINDSESIDEYLKLSINKSGDLCYYLGILDDKFRL